MAQFSQILIGTSPAVDQKVSALATATASSEIVLAPRTRFVICAYGASATGSGGIAIAFGKSGLAAPTAANYQFPVGQQTTFDTGAFASIRLFNNSGVTCDIYIKPLASV